MRYLLDSNLLSETTKPAPDFRVELWLTIHESEAAVSVLTMGELEKGVLLLPAGRRRTMIETWFQRIRLRMQGRILAIDEKIMTCWAELYAGELRRGRRLEVVDSLLAATAVHHRLTIATRNVRDFPTDVALVNPWEA